MLYSQYQQGRETLDKNYKKDQTSHQNSTATSNGPMAEENEGDAPVVDENQKKKEAAYVNLVEVLDELAYHHSQVPTL